MLNKSLIGTCTLLNWISLTVLENISKQGHKVSSDLDAILSILLQMMFESISFVGFGPNCDIQEKFIHWKWAEENTKYKFGD